MLFLKLLSAIASLFAIYPLYKLIKRDEINIFDLIILFHTIFFCIIPLFSDHSAFQWLKGFQFEYDIILRVFTHYTIFSFLMFLFDRFWTKHNKYKRNVLNITYYIKTLPRIKASWIFLVILLVNMIISWLWYLPQASYMETFAEFSKSQGFTKSPMYLFYGIIFTFCFSFSQILFLKEKLPLSKRYIIFFTLLGFGLLLLFMPRRIMLFYFITSLIIIYSIKRDFFSKKSITLITLFIFFLIKIYFPFYNVMRWSKIEFDDNNFTTSLIQIIEDTNERFDSQKENAAKTAEGRSLNLYYALYKIVKYDYCPSNGKLLLAAIDHATPRIINPNKGSGTERILEKKTFSKDQADSILLLAYGDFGFIIGSFYSFLLFLFVIFIHTFFNRISLKFNNSSTIGVPLVIYLISLAWNVEGNLDGIFASFVHLAIMSILLIVLSKLNIVRYKESYLKQ